MFKALLPGGSPNRKNPLGWEAYLERKIRMRLLPVEQVQPQVQPQAQQEYLEESFQPADQQADQQADQPQEQQPLTVQMDFRSLT